jgi:type VI secretion system protein ImpM
MSRPPVPVQLVYFGKLPSRGDFIRSANQPSLIQVLDTWLSQTMELMSSDDARWKVVYDAAPAVQFAFLGTRSQVGLAGHLVTSSDTSGRRFPFIAAGTFELADPLPFMARSPLALNRLWTRFEASTRQAASASDFGQVQGLLAATSVNLEVAPEAYQANYIDFLETQSLASVEAMLAAAGHEVSMRQSLLAYGLLLQPVLTQGVRLLERGLVLPLPADALYRPFVATLWIDLLANMLQRSEVELALYLQGGTARPQLVVGFNGASPTSLRAMLDSAVLDADNVFIAQAAWVEDHLGDDYGIKKLSSYLLDPQLSLLQAVKTFREVFLGE